MSCSEGLRGVLRSPSSNPMGFLGPWGGRANPPQPRPPGLEAPHAPEPPLPPRPPGSATPSLSRVLRPVRPRPALTAVGGPRDSGISGSSFPLGVLQLHCCVPLKILPQGRREQQLPSKEGPSKVKTGLSDRAGVESAPVLGGRVSIPSYPVLGSEIIKEGE